MIISGLNQHYKQAPQRNAFTNNSKTVLHQAKAHLIIDNHQLCLCCNTAITIAICCCHLFLPVFNINNQPVQLEFHVKTLDLSYVSSKMFVRDMMQLYILHFTAHHNFWTLKFGSSLIKHLLSIRDGL